MPELPEVETVKKGLRRKIIGKKVGKLEPRGEKTFSGNPDDVNGTSIDRIERRAKILVFSLSNKNKIIIHLKMTGQLIFDPRESLTGDYKGRVAGGHPNEDFCKDMPNKHTRAIFHFDDGSVLYFNNVRKFGYLRIYKKGEQIPELDNIGVDGLSNKMTGEYLQEKAKNRSIAIKQFIMDQSVVAGMGNIYSDEALFCAKISPKRSVSNISDKEFSKLAGCIKEVLEKGVEHNGTSSRNYVDSDGNRGDMQNYLKVYGQEGQGCPGCKGKIKKKKIGGRSAHFCPKCQK